MGAVGAVGHRRAGDGRRTQWEIFEDVAPELPAWAQSSGPWRCDDRAVLAAIIFGAASGCTLRQTPPVFGASRQTVHRRFMDCRRLGRGRSRTEWCWIGSARTASWTGRGAPPFRSVSGQSEGGHRTESDRSWQARVEDPRQVTGIDGHSRFLVIAEIVVRRDRARQMRCSSGPAGRTASFSGLPSGTSATSGRRSHQSSEMNTKQPLRICGFRQYKAPPPKGETSRQRRSACPGGRCQ
ncbi:hypothetical protein AV521_32345 [Streptomyces sp. IMTB 2501]|nr:hypothetical protein AV521_32345 [Streptomyces sp. IMTB 2501]